jgi:cytosine/adenosine deaminase-related metal-dependent hydrolase
MQGPVIPGGAVVFTDRILAVGAAPAITAAYPEAEVEELGDVCLMPGLINAHTHLELSTLTPGDPPAGFVPWLLRLMGNRPPTPAALEESIQQSIAQGVAQCLRFGVTAVGDISRQCALTRPLLGTMPLRVVSYGEVQAMAQRRGFLEERLATAVDAAPYGSRLTVGITPHAPYSIERLGYERCLAVARQGRLPLATHLAETVDEAAFLADHAGPLRGLWDHLQAWDEQVPRFTGGPIRWARDIGLLDYPTLLAHVNYLDEAELEILAAGRASVVYCPRTHAYFGHAPHRFREMLSRGINVALGTDSCASAPDLNVVEDLRQVYAMDPTAPAQELWQLITTRAAQAIGQEAALGAIAPGKAADFVAFAAQGPDPLADILHTFHLPQKVWIAGQAVAPHSA